MSLKTFPDPLSDGLCLRDQQFYLKRVKGCIGKARQGPTSHIDLSVDVEVLVANFDCGEFDPNPANEMDSTSDEVRFPLKPTKLEA
jgi:hypothetical protein